MFISGLHFWLLRFAIFIINGIIFYFSRSLEAMQIPISRYFLSRQAIFLTMNIGIVFTGNPDAKRLYDDLLSNYNKLVRPVSNVSEAVTVHLKLKLSQLIAVVSPSLLMDTCCNNIVMYIKTCVLNSN